MRIIITPDGTTSDYSEKLNCCGGPLMTTHRDSALTKAGEKLKAVQERGFDALTIVCPLGGRILDSKHDRAAGMVGEKLDMPVFYLTQLVGLSMGMESKGMGLNLNKSPVGKLI